MLKSVPVGLGGPAGMVRSKGSGASLRVDALRVNEVEAPAAAAAPAPAAVATATASVSGVAGEVGVEGKSVV